jgi:hypothetical protein
MQTAGGQRDEIRRFLGEGLLFLLPLLLAYELCCGGWLRDSSLDELYLLRNVDKYVDVSQYYGPPGTLVHLKVDQYGFRGAYHDPSHIDILTMGSSTTLQDQIGEGETWQDLIRAGFARDGRELAIVNAGVDAQSTRGFLRDFELWFPKIPGLKARYVLVYLGVEEVLKASDELKYKTDMDGLKARRTLSRYLQSKSASYRTAHGLLMTWWAHALKGAGHQHVALADIQWTATPLQQDYDVLLKDELDGFAERLRLLTRRIRDFGASPIYVMEPEGAYRGHGAAVVGRADTIEVAGRQFNGVDLYRAMRLLSDTARSVAAQSGAPYFDVGEDVDFGPEDFYDFHHCTPSGVRKVGEYLHARLKGLI